MNLRIFCCLNFKDTITARIFNLTSYIWFSIRYTHTHMHARACARPFPGKYRPHLPVLLSIIYIIMIEYWLEKKTSKKRPEGWDWWADFLSRFLSAGCLPKAGTRIYLTQLTMTWGWMVLLQIPWALILKVCNVLQ